MAVTIHHPDVNPLHAVTAAPEPPEEGAPLAAPVIRIEHRESLLTRMIEHQAAKVPSDFFLMAAFASMGFSLAAELTGRSRASRFVGMWPGPLLIMGLYNKVVKTLGPR
jgi:hypothetical protein